MSQHQSLNLFDCRRTIWRRRRTTAQQEAHDKVLQFAHGEVRARTNTLHTQSELMQRVTARHASCSLNALDRRQMSASVNANDGQRLHLPTNDTNKQQKNRFEFKTSSTIPHINSQDRICSHWESRRCVSRRDDSNRTKQDKQQQKQNKTKPKNQFFISCLLVKEF